MGWKTNNYQIIAIRPQYLDVELEVQGSITQSLSDEVKELVGIKKRSKTRYKMKLQGKVNVTLVEPKLSGHEGKAVRVIDKRNDDC